MSACNGKHHACRFYQQEMRTNITCACICISSTTAPDLGGGGGGGWLVNASINNLHGQKVFSRPIVRYTTFMS